MHYTRSVDIVLYHTASIACRRISIFSLLYGGYEERDIVWTYQSFHISTRLRCVSPYNQRRSSYFMLADSVLSTITTMKHIFCLLICCSLASNGQFSSEGIVVIGSTVYPGHENLDDCLAVLPKETQVVGSEVYKCLSPNTTPKTPGDPPGLAGGFLKVEKNEGETVTFTCTVRGFQINDTFIWRAPRRFIPTYSKQGENVVTPAKSPRFSYSSINSTRWEMTIRDLEKRDAGIYSCGITSHRITENDGMVSKYFNLTVQYIVSINGILPKTFPYAIEGQPHHLFFNETDNVTLSCLSEGVPTPDTYWRRGNSSHHNLPSGEEMSLGRNLSIFNISVKDAGVYVCESKQLLYMDVRNTTIVVQHKPFVREEEILIRKKRGSSVQLVCHIDSEPLPFEVQWIDIGGAGKIRKESTQKTKEGSRYHILSLDPGQHYGNYTCTVTNILGKSTCRFEITGRPAKPKIVSSSHSNKMRVYTLQWTYEDYDIINKKWFRINYTQKKYKDRTDYLDYKVPLLYNPKKPMEYNTTLHDLRANSTYYLELFAVNRYGEGDIETFEFTTAAVDKLPPPRHAQRMNPDGPKGGGRWLQASLHTTLCSMLIYLLLLWK